MSDRDPLADLSIRVEGLAARTTTVERGQKAAGEAMTRIIADLKGLRGDLVAAVRDLGAAKNKPTDLTPEWLSIEDPVKAADVLIDVHRWVEAVWVHHMPSIAPCWPLHGRAVEDLRALHSTWAEAVATPDKPHLMTGWMVQCRRPLAADLKETLSMCSPEEHRDGAQAVQAVVDLGADPIATLTAIAEWWVSWRGTITAGVPVPGLTVVNP